MNRGGAFESSNSSSSIQQMMWNLNNMRPPPLPLIPSPSSSTSISSSSSAASASSPSSSSVLFPQYSQISNLQLMSTPWPDNQEFPESWRQLLLGGSVEEDERCSFFPFETKKMENWEQHQVQAYPPSSDNIVDVKKVLLCEKGYNTYGQRSEEIQAPRSPWSQILPNSSPRSCVTTTSFNSNMLDFTNNSNNSNNHKAAAGAKHLHQDPSSQECNSPPTGSPYKKARAQPSTQSTFKVRKEKLGDRITALHQLVSPFGKTDTASVLLEAIGYIRFLQSQIEALSLPYLASGSANMKPQQQQHHHHLTQVERSCIFPEDPGQLLNVDNCIMKRIVAPDQDGVVDDEPKKDLRSRGLCLVPVSFTMHVGSDNGADYWAPSFGGGFR